MVWKYEVNFMCVAYPGTVIALKEEGRKAVKPYTAEAAEEAGNGKENAGR